MIYVSGIGVALFDRMVPSFTNRTASKEYTAEDRWAEITQWTLEACTLRAEGREGEAIAILQEKMPALINEWSVICGLRTAEVQQRLRAMLAETQSFVARGLAQRRIITAQIVDQYRPVPANPDHAPTNARPAVGLRRHVAVGDITGMLDGLAEAERESRREQFWPVRSPATYAAAAF